MRWIFFLAGVSFLALASACAAAWMLPLLFPRLRRKGGGEAAELLPVMDEDGRVIGKATRSVCHSGKGAAGLLHPVVRLMLSDGSGGLWLQKRSMDKLVQPGRWDCAVGGHVSSGETIETALSREAFEEIGLKDARSARLVDRYVWQTSLERELAFLYVMDAGKAELKANPDEVSELRAWSRAEIAAEMEKPAARRAFTEMLSCELEKYLSVMA